jgi:hypothetical protein
MSHSINLQNPEIHTATWLPFGRNEMEALNRFVGSHKKYTSPTEFGIGGIVNDLGKGSFTMKNHGIFLVPVDYSFTNYLHARLKEDYHSNREYGLSVYKNGLTALGVSHNGQMDIDDAKMITGQLTYQFTDCVFPVLNDVQQSLISSLYEEEDLSRARHKIHSYSLVTCDPDGIEYKSSEELLQAHPNTVEALTDWIIAHTTIENCHIFMGMAAILCVGKPTRELKEALRYVLYLQTCLKTSQRMHSLLWSLRKRIHNVRNSIKVSNYKNLKENNELICVLNDHLSKLKVFDGLLRKETMEMAEKWNEVTFPPDDFKERVHHRYRDEVEKSDNREATISQLTEELAVLTSEVENRLELIMTRDNMRLNIILLILTIVSVLGVAEVVGFSKEQWQVVAAFLLPFTFITIIYIRNFLKNFNKKT